MGRARTHAVVSASFFVCAASCACLNFGTNIHAAVFTFVFRFSLLLLLRSPIPHERLPERLDNVLGRNQEKATPFAFCFALL
jgi:hypothetical protein